MAGRRVAVERMTAKARIETIGIGLLCAVTVLWSGSLALGQAVWNPLDEGSHWLAANSIAMGTYPGGGGPATGMPADLPAWPGDAVNEVLQPPVNYALMAGIEKAMFMLDSWPVLSTGDVHLPPPRLASVYAMRLSNALLFGILVLLLWLTARTIAPGHLGLAWGMPATVLLLHGPVVDSTRAGNDVLVGVLATLAIYLALRWRQRLTWQRGLVVGVVAALATLSKYPGMFALIPVGLLALARLRGEFQRIAAYLGAVFAAWLVPVAIWLAWSQRHLGVGNDAWSAANPPGSLFHHSLGELVADVPVNLRNLMIGQLGRVASNTHQTILYALMLLLGLALVAGLTVLSRRGATQLSRAECLALLASTPCILLVLALAAWVSGVRLIQEGRYDLPGMATLAFSMLAWLLVIPRPWARPEADGGPVVAAPAVES
jgi:hypothetical protein